MNCRIAELRGAIDVELAQRKKDGIFYELWGEQRSQHEVYLKSLERRPAEVVIEPWVIPVYPRAHSLAAAKSFWSSAAAKYGVDFCIDVAVPVGYSKSTSLYPSVPNMGNGDTLDSFTCTTADANAAREAERDVYAAKIRTAIAGEIEKIIRE